MTYAALSIALVAAIGAVWLAVEVSSGLPAWGGMVGALIATVVGALSATVAFAAAGMSERGATRLVLCGFAAVLFCLPPVVLVTIRLGWWTP